MGKMPVTGLSEPSNASSPKNTVPSVFAVKRSAAIRILTARGKSYCEPSFLMSAGARFIVILFTGKFIALFFIAARTLSLLSFTAASGKPTKSKDTMPLFMSVSTSTGTPSSPQSVKLVILESIFPPLHTKFKSSRA